MYKIFLSHNSVDKPQVKNIAHRLCQEGFDPWLDEWDLIVGDKWQDGLEQSLKTSDVCLVFIGANGQGPWHKAEMRVAIDQSTSRQQLRIIPVFLPEAPDDAAEQLPSFLRAYNGVRFYQSLEDGNAFRKLVAGINNERLGPDVDLSEIENPYRGLEYFGIQNAPFFFGREKVVHRLLDLVKPANDLVGEVTKKRFLAIIGASGSGKSSVARAGLLATLQNDGIKDSASWPQLICMPGKQPLESLAVAINAHPKLQSCWDTAELIEKLRSNALQLHHSGLEFLHEEDRQKIILLIDQFEEVFTLCEDKNDRDAFVENLLHAAEESTGKIIVIITLRADFYSQCTAYPKLSRYFEAQQSLLNPMSEAELREVIEAPAKKVGYGLEEGLVDVILADAQRQPGTLPLLEYSLMRLWEQRSSQVLRLRDYQSFGGLGGALEQRANELYQNFPEPMQDHCRLVFRRLVQPGEGTTDTRRRARLDELGDSEQTQKVVQTLANARLLTTQEKDGTAFVEVSHEALIREWSQLQEWIEEDRAQLRFNHQVSSAANDWTEHNKEESWLLSGARLATAVEWIDDNEAEANELEKLFVSSSRDWERSKLKAAEYELEVKAELERQQRVTAEELASEQQKSLKQSRWMTSALFVLTAVMLFVTDYAWKSAKEARSAEQLSEKSQQITEKTLLSLEKEQGKTKQALKKIEVAYAEAKKNFDDARSKELQAKHNLAKFYEEKASSELLRSQSIDKGGYQYQQALRNSLLYFFESGAEITPEDDKSTINTVASQLTTIDPIWIAPERKYTPILNYGASSTANNSIGKIIFIKNSGQIMSSDYWSNKLSLWSSHSGELIKSLVVPNNWAGGIRDFDYNNDQDSIAVIKAQDKDVLIIDSKTGDVLKKFKGHIEKPTVVKYSPDQSTIASGDFDNTIRLWDIESGRTKNILKGHNGFITSLSYDSYGKKLISSAFDGTIKIWDTNDGRNLKTIKSPYGIWNLAYSPDGVFFAVFSKEKSIEIYKTTDGGLFKSIKVSTEGLIRLTFSPDSKNIALGYKNGLINILRVKSEKILKSIDAEANNIRNLIYSTDGKHFAYTSKDLSITLLKIDGGNVSPSPGHTESINSIVYSPVGKYIASGSDDTTIRIWNSLTGETVNVLRGHSKVVNKLIYSPNGESIASGSDDTTVRLWDAEKGKELKILKGHTDEVSDLSYSASGELLASGSKDKTIRIWSTQTGEELKILELSSEVISLAYSPDDRSIAYTLSDKSINLWDINRNELLANFNENKYKIDAFTFSKNGYFIFMSNGSVIEDEYLIKVWDIRKNKITKSFFLPSKVTDLVYDDGNNELAVSSMDGMIRFVHAETGKIRKTLHGSGSWVNAISYSPSKKIIASAAANGSIYFWDSYKENTYNLTDSKQTGLRALAIKSDASKIISSGKGLSVWDLKNGRLIHNIKGHKYYTKAIAYNADSGIIASGGEMIRLSFGI